MLLYVVSWGQNNYLIGSPDLRKSNNSLCDHRRNMEAWYLYCNKDPKRRGSWQCSVVVLETVKEYS